MRVFMCWLLGGLCLSLTFAGSALGGQRTRAFTLTPTVGVSIFEGNQQLATAGTYGLTLGYNPDSHISVEGAFQYTNTNPDTAPAVDVDLYGMRLDLLYHFFPESRLVPFVAVGAGTLHLATNRINIGYDSFQAAYGGGVQFFLNDLLALRLDARHVIDYGARNIMDFGQTSGRALSTFNVTAGLSFQFGGRSAVSPPRMYSGASDVEPVEETQTAVVEPVDAPGEDVLPVETVALVPASQGDSDPLVTAVYAVETREPLNFVLNIPFSYDSAEIKPEYLGEIERAGELFQRFAEETIRCDGYADNLGSTTYNLGLSLMRAENICGYLAKHFNIPESRIQIKAHGEMDPVASNATLPGRSLNRRVLLRSIAP